MGWEFRIGKSFYGDNMRSSSFFVHAAHFAFTLLEFNAFYVIIQFESSVLSKELLWYEREAGDREKCYALILFEYFGYYKRIIVGFCIC